MVGCGSGIEVNGRCCKESQGPERTKSYQIGKLSLAFRTCKISLADF